MTRFRDRTEAGRRLAAALRSYATENPIVLALPRGGVPVGYEVAHALHAPLDVVVVRKLGVPWHPELGVGAVAEGGFTYLNEDVLRHVGLSQSELDELVRVKQREVEARVSLFRGGRAKPRLRDRTVLLVDDGIATGGTVQVAIRAVRAESPAAIVLAVPVAAPDAVRELGAQVQRVVCLETPPELYAIGVWYDDFAQVPEEEVVRLLERARQEHDGASRAAE
jgi:predicted phosphoribosyltransferase